MKQSTTLLPSSFKRIGWAILIPTFVLSILYLNRTTFSYSWLEFKVISLFPGNGEVAKISVEHFADEILSVLIIMSSLMIGFAREKDEDEAIASFRLSAHRWSLLITVSILLLGILFTFGLVFLNVLIYNMFTPVLVFVLRYNYLLIRHRSQKPIENEKFTTRAASL